MGEYKSDIPWADTKLWEKYKWYPLPLGYMERDTPGWIHDSWGIFVYDAKADNGDIYPIIGGGLTFSQALEICEDKNESLFFEKDKEP